MFPEFFCHCLGGFADSCQVCGVMRCRDLLIFSEIAGTDDD